MKSLDVKMYQDGRDLVLVIKDCSPDIRRLLEGLLSPVLEDAAAAEPDAPLSNPVLHATEGRRIGPYEGRTVLDILKEDQDKGFANIMFLVGDRRLDLTEDEMVDLLHITDSYFEKRLSEYGDPYEAAAKASDDEVENFFKYFVTEFDENSVRELCQKTGTLSIEAFRKDVATEIKRSAMAQLLEQMQKNS